MTLPQRPSSPLPSICSPLCYPFVFRRRPQTSAAPTDYEPAGSYVYFGIELYRYQNVNAGVLQDLRYSTEPQLQVRMLHVAVGDEGSDIYTSYVPHSRTSSSLAFAFNANSDHYNSHQHSHSGSLTPSPAPYVPSSYLAYSD
jgi:hypothetical protein